MLKHGTGIRRLLMGTIGVALTALPAFAESVEEFYTNKKTLIMMAGTRPGGSYGLYGGILARHMPKYIPGKPKIQLQYMPGAGGGKAANYLFNAAPKDGSVMLSTHAIPILEKMRGKGIRFKSGEMTWIGSMGQINQLMAVWHTSPVTTLAGMKKTQLIIGAFSKNHPTFQWPALLNNLVGTKFKIIVGYRGGATNHKAMEQGETNGWAPSWGNLNGTKPEYLRDKKVAIVTQFGLERLAELPDVPTLRELVPASERDIVDFLTAATPVSRALALPPGVPADRVAALRKAFAMTMKDPGFLADIKERNLPLHPRTGAEVKKFVDLIVDASPELIARVKKATAGPSSKRMKK
jgi:tripartite-type tricarboxylate transporter receptor subunit TctC